MTFYVYKIFSYRFLGTVQANGWEEAKEKAIASFGNSWCDMIVRATPLPEDFL